MTRERFLVKSYGDNIEGTKHGLIKLLQLLEKYNSAIIVVPSFNHIKSSLLATALGDELSKLLIKDREIVLNGGKSLYLCSQATLKNHKNEDVYLDLWGNKESIQKVEDLPQAKAIILVTWLPEDSIYWQESNQVSVIFDDKKG